MSLPKKTTLYGYWIRVLTRAWSTILVLEKATKFCLEEEILHLFFDPLSLQHIGFKVVLVDQLSGEHKSQVEVLKQTSEEMNIIPLISGLSSISS